MVGVITLIIQITKLVMEIALQFSKSRYLEYLFMSALLKAKAKLKLDLNIFPIRNNEYKPVI